MTLGLLGRGRVQNVSFIKGRDFQPPSYVFKGVTRFLVGQEGPEASLPAHPSHFMPMHEVEINRFSINRCQSMGFVGLDAGPSHHNKSFFKCMTCITSLSCPDWVGLAAAKEPFLPTV